MDGGGPGGGGGADDWGKEGGPEVLDCCTLSITSLSFLFLFISARNGNPPAGSGGAFGVEFAPMGGTGGGGGADIFGNGGGGGAAILGIGGEEEQPY